MSEIDDERPTSEPRAQVRAWWLRLRSGRATRDDTHAYESWRAGQTEHARAADEFSRAWTALHAAAAEIVDEQPDVTQAWRAAARRTRTVRTGRRALLGFAAAAGVSWLAFRPPLQLWPSLGELAADYRTGTGEQRRVALSEAVVVQMNTQTRIDVLHAGPAAPHGVSLLAGEAEIIANAAPGSGGAGPVVPAVVIEAGAGRLHARVARFDVQRTGRRVCVTCASGELVVEHPQRRLTLAAAQQIVFDDHAVSPVAHVDPAVTTAWREGLLVFRDVPLAQVIDEINRYRPGRVILRNAGLAGNKVRAEIAIARIDGAVGMLAKLYDLRVVRLPGDIALLT